MDNNTGIDNNSKGISAKTASLISKILGVCVLLAGSVLKWLGIFNNCEISELCTVVGTMVALFSTVDINIALDKFTKRSEE